jgi:hypothetical protein
MIRFINHYLKIALTTVACAFATTSCQDDLWFGNDGPEEGQPATITVGIQVTDMDEKTRSIIDEDARNYCNNVWVGVFRVSSDASKNGERIFSNVYTTEPSSRQEEMETNYGLNEFEIETESGNARIVAIANVDNEQASETPDGGRESLRTALGNAKTWEQFKQIIVHKDNVGDATIRTGTLMMYGYYEDADNSNITSDDETTIVPVQKGENKMAGAIHLRRLTSYNKVNISAGDNITMTLDTWKVGNIPTDSYVFDKNTGNAGSLVSSDPYGESTETHIFTLNEKTQDDEKDSYSFEFYQYENKHTACAYADLGDGDYVGIKNGYADREREYKNAITPANATYDPDQENTSIYKSLVADKSGSLDNNNASYFVFTADLDYYIEDTQENRDNPGLAKAVPYDAGKALIHRTASATYTVHLGYCDGDDELTKAKDFNCLRNTKYTYNIRVLGVNKIVVEAKREGEVQPGAEGTVLDDYGDYVPMDAHYCVYNIGLTNYERAHMKYRVNAPYNGTTYTFNSENYKTSWEDDQLYTWIKIKPTTGKDVLAKYKENENDNNLWSLHALLDVEGYPWANWSINDKGELSTSNEDKTIDDDKTVHYYTVFVDEYVYHKTLEGESEGDLESLWYTYVNQDDRTVQLYTNMDHARDGESDYTFCKYTIAQKSIQTYYKYDASNPEDEVLGVEHTDENYGLNYSWLDLTNGNKTDQYYGHDRYFLSANNGRWNNLLYIQTRDSIYSYDGTSYDWDQYVRWTTPDYIAAGSISDFSLSHDAVLYPVPLFKDLGGSNSNHWSTQSEIHRANAACMNRNRDLNGDGKITADELRWYLPTGNQYIQISIGQLEMRSPLIDVMSLSKDLFQIGENRGRTDRLNKNQYHYATSDDMYFWAEEVGSLGDRPYGSQGEKQLALSVRCVRNLGANPKILEDNETEIKKPYEYNAEDNTFTQSRYTDNALRGYVGTYILPHDAGSEESRPYKKFKMASKDCKNITDEGYLSVGSGGVISFVNASDEGTKTYRWYESLIHNGVCSQYYENSDKSDKGTWRVPTIREMGLIYSEGLMTTHYMSSSRAHFTVLKQASSTTGYIEGYKADMPYEFLGYRDGQDKLIKQDNMMNVSGDLHVRCVKDVK